MTDTYTSEQLQDTVEILDRLLISKKWEFLRKTLKKYLICFDFLLCEQDELYLQYWHAVEKELGVKMEVELATVYEEWLAGYGIDFIIRTGARLGALLRSIGCHGDFTLRLTLQELRVLEIWEEQYWLEHVCWQLQKIYIARGQLSDAECLVRNTLFTHVKCNTSVVSFGHALIDAELLEATEPVFMNCTQDLPRDTLLKRYNLAKYFQNIPANESVEVVH
mgnify:CR=1 FL=1|jgi:hypothetical protein